MNIINRIGWYRQPGRYWNTRALNTVKVITVHHTADTMTLGNDGVLKTEAQTHYNNGWPGLSYHYFITKDGSIYQINELSEVTWHDAVNWDSVGIALHGYFHTPYFQKPTDAQLKSLRFLLDELTNKTPAIPAAAANVFGHRERSSTACPGDNLIWYPQNYRMSNGDVAWGEYAPQTPPPVNYDWTLDQKVKVVDLVQKGSGTVQKYKIRDILKIPMIP